MCSAQASGVSQVSTGRPSTARAYLLGRAATPVSSAAPSLPKRSGPQARHARAVSNSKVPQNCGSFVFWTSRVTDYVPFVICHRQLSTPVRRTTVYKLKDVFIVHFRVNQNLPKLRQKWLVLEQNWPESSHLDFEWLPWPVRNLNGQCDQSKGLSLLTWLTKCMYVKCVRVFIAVSRQDWYNA